MQICHLTDGQEQKDKSVVVAAHETSIAQLAFNKMASLLATCSEKGTLIRLFDAITGDKLHELRRGSEPAQIQSISFEWESCAFLTCSSDRDTIHIFKVAGEQKEAA